MPQARICLDCNALYTPPPDHTHTYGRCPPCRTTYHTRRQRGQHRATPARELANRFYASTAWKRVRDDVRQRDGACTTCGTTTHLTVHHIASIHDAPERALDPTNLVTLCRSCHGRTGNSQKRRRR